MSIARLTIATLIATFVVGSFPAYAGKPSVSQARPLLEAMGQSLVDFQKCNGNWESISDIEVDFTSACARSDTDSDLMDKIYDLAKKDRRDEVRASGFSCRGNMSDRLDLVLSTVKAAIAQCEQ